MLNSWRNSIRQFLLYNCNKYLWRNIKGAFSNLPYDFGFFYLRQREYLEQMLAYFKKTKYLYDEDKNRITRYLKLAIRTVSIGYIDGVDFMVTKIENPSETNPIGRYDIKCVEKVNRRNIKRFFPRVPDSSMNLIQDYQLYEQKAKYLYHKIMLEKSHEWSD